ncbi:MAG: hypothetical protein ACKPKO_38880, partial [Candidatus Fonsibacter sp.]
MRKQEYRENDRFAREPQRRTYNPGDEDREEDADAQREAAQRARPQAKAGPKGKAKAGPQAKAKAQSKAEAQPPVETSSRRRALFTEEGPTRNQRARARARSVDNVRTAPAQYNPEAEAQPRGLSSE